MRTPVAASSSTRPREAARGHRQTRGSNSRAAPHPSKQPHAPPPPLTGRKRHRDKQCIIRNGASPSGPASCARRTGRATPTSSGRADPPPMPRPSDLVVDNVRRARPCLRRNDYIETRSATLEEVAGTAPRRRPAATPTRGAPPRTMEEGEAPSRQLASKRPSSAIDPNPPRPLGGRSGTK